MSRIRKGWRRGIELVMVLALIILAGAVGALAAPDPPVRPVAGGGYHTLAVLEDGTVRAWGRNNYGQLGDGTTTQRNNPVAVSGLGGMAAVAGGYYHSLALKNDGTVWAWGYNWAGQLGDGSTWRAGSMPGLWRLQLGRTVGGRIDRGPAYSGGGQRFEWSDGGGGGLRPQPGAEERRYGLGLGLE